MARFFKKRNEIIGKAPGSLIFIGVQKMDQSRISLTDYNETELNEEEIKSIEDVKSNIDSENVTWINIDGLHDTKLIKETGGLFNFHPLLMEDILNTAQRPKMDDYDEQIFVSMKMLTYNNSKNLVYAEQVGMVLGEKWLITFQEQIGDVFDHVRNRIRKSKGRIRTAGNDYLMYALIDTVVDNYIDIIEKIGEKIEELEEKILSNTDKKILEELYTYKKEISFLTKVIRPVKDLVGNLLRNDSNIISDEVLPFIRDLQDLVTHTNETLETYRNLLKDYQELYNNGVNNKLNSIMKVLTIFASIFIPLTFIAGIYGTNFDHLPELHYKYSYFIMWGVMILIAGIMLIMFRVKKWF